MYLAKSAPHESTGPHTITDMRHTCAVRCFICLSSAACNVCILSKSQQQQLLTMTLCAVVITANEKLNDDHSMLLSCYIFKIFIYGFARTNKLGNRFIVRRLYLCSVRLPTAAATCSELRLATEDCTQTKCSHITTSTVFRPFFTKILFSNYTCGFQMEFSETREFREHQPKVPPVVGKKVHK